jgi:hypothetical protein
MSSNILQEKLNAYKNQHKMLGDLIEKMEAILPYEQKINMLFKGIDVEETVVKSEKNYSNRSKSTAKKNSTKNSTKRKPSRVKDVIASSSSIDKPISLPALVQKIVSESKHPLTYSEVADLALKHGYKSSAKNFANNVYQSLNIHVRNKVLRQEKVDGTMKFCA